MGSTFMFFRQDCHVFLFYNFTMLLKVGVQDFTVLLSIEQKLLKILL